MVHWCSLTYKHVATHRVLRVASKRMKQNSNITKFRIHLSADKPQAVTGKVTYGASGGRTSSVSHSIG